jgi:hypothetical protein
MNLEEYTVLDTGLANKVGRELQQLAMRASRAAARLVERLERFIKDTEDGHLVAPEFPNGRLEVYAVPPPPDLQRLPDALFLVRVNHVARTIEMIALFENYPSPEGPLWEHITQVARNAIQ